jgi:hypothetical protein
MTRKGLAVGAATALLAAGLTGAPAAFASETLSLAPSSGTAYASLTTSTFSLSAGFAGTESTEAAGTLKFRVKNAASASLTPNVIEGSDTSETVFAYGTTATSVLSGTDTTNADFIAYSTTGTPVIGAKQELTLVPTAHTADVTVQVQAWLDLNGDGDIDTNEPRSPERTVVFYDQANVTLGTLTVSNFALGVNTFVAVATTSPELNYQQVTAGDIKVQGLKNVSTTSGSAGNLAWDAARSQFRGTITLGENVAAGTTYGGRLQITNGSAMVNTGVASFNTETGGKVTAVSTVDNLEGTSITGDTLRAGSGTFRVFTNVTVGATDSKVQAVTFTIAETGVNTLHSGAVFTMGGKTLSNTSTTTTQTVDVVVNSVERNETTGRAILEISYTGLKDGNTIIVKASAVGASAVIADSTGDTFTGADSVAAALVDNVSGQLRVAKGSSMTVGYTVVDQFGQTPVGNFQIVLSENGTTANYSNTIAIAGTASYTVTENSTANQDYNLTATLQKQALDLSWANLASSITEVTAISAVTAATPATVTAAAADSGSVTPLALFLEDYAAGDSELLRASSFESYTGTTISGTVKDASGALLAGAPVTLSAAGLQFVFTKDGSNKLYAQDSISITTDANGAYSVLVSSHKSGKHTIAVTSGTGSASVAVTWAAAAANTAENLSITAPAFAAAGSTYRVTAKLTDYYGNPVKVVNADTPNVATSYAGPGIVFGNLPTETSAAGELSFSVLLGATDSGSATITVSYDLDGDGVKDYADFSTAATVTVGAAPVAAADTKVNAGSFKGFVAVYAKGYEGKRLSAKIGNDWVVVNSLASNFVRVTDFTGAGVSISVRVYIDRVLVGTFPLVTK